MKVIEYIKKNKPEWITITWRSYYDLRDRREYSYIEIECDDEIVEKIYAADPYTVRKIAEKILHQLPYQFVREFNATNVYWIRLKRIE